MYKAIIKVLNRKIDLNQHSLIFETKKNLEYFYMHTIHVNEPLKKGELWII